MSRMNIEASQRVKVNLSFPGINETFMVGDLISGGVICRALHHLAVAFQSGRVNSRS